MSLPKILTVHKGQVVIDESVLSIPEFKECYEVLGINYLQFLWAKFDPQSPYQNYSEYDRDDFIIKDLPENINRHDITFIQASNKCEELYFSPIRKILKGAKKAIENLSGYLETEEIIAGRDGNLSQIVTTIKTLPQIIKAYKEAEFAYNQEVQSNRADAMNAIDEGFEDNYD